MASGVNRTEGANWKEAVGPNFSLPAMLRAQDLTFQAVRRIAGAIGPGMTEGEAQILAAATLADMAMERIWHRTIIRFGEGTLEPFKAPVRPDRALKANDIFFVDLGVVWDGHEGDAGETFVVGEDADMSACAEAAKTLWQDVSDTWRREGLSGAALYGYASGQAKARGWRLNLSVKGHRVSDFPHMIYKAGALGRLESRPTPGLWILEIQLTHPTRPFGAFFEDLLIAS